MSRGSSTMRLEQSENVVTIGPIDFDFETVEGGEALGPFTIISYDPVRKRHESALFDGPLRKIRANLHSLATKKLGICIGFASFIPRCPSCEADPSYQHGPPSGPPEDDSDEVGP